MRVRDREISRCLLAFVSVISSLAVFAWQVKVQVQASRKACVNVSACTVGAVHILHACFCQLACVCVEVCVCLCNRSVCTGTGVCA